MADESETMMSATLRFPFQASLDGYAMVETDGNLYYGLDISLEPAELPAQAYSHSNSESDSQSGLGLESNDDEDEDKPQQQEQQSNSKNIFYPPRLVSLVKDKEQEQKQEPEKLTSRPVSVLMHPHRINTSDQQRFATEHEMAAAEEAEEENIICESPSTSTLDETEVEEESTIRVSVPSSSAQRFIPSRYYATPLIKDDLTSTPVAIYGLEKPSDHVSKKKAPAVLRQRGNSAAAQARPSSHQHQPSPLSAVNHDNRAEEASRASTSSTRRLSMFLGREHTPTVPSAGVSRPMIGSISSSGSSATTATMRSAASAVSDVSNATSISTSSSPTIVDANQKPASHSPSTTPAIDQTPSFTRPAQPLRRPTAPIPSFTTDHAALTGGDTRRNSIFNFSKPKFSSPMMHHRAGIQSGENLTTIRAVTDDQVTPTPAATESQPFHESSLEASSSSSKQMPFSPDSFVSPHTHAHTSESYDITNSTSDSNVYNNNTTSFSQTNRPHTSHHDQRPAAISNTSSPQYQPYTRNEQQPQPPIRKLKKSDHHQHRATKLFTRMFVTDLNQKA
ncbi:hypothetical protein DPV78_002631 [Talaromyces pinophilus]|nr:hypothetical protein DPV78_002631 [Talaromyces pinophilus]